ncbi:MAG: BamA/TamA family outer membrane protein [Candidatus Aminicenantes bacterium]|nr:BamA/TamA family outer membrane protein [Candidatus Aminicenantes bacterium]
MPGKRLERNHRRQRFFGAALLLLLALGEPGSAQDEAAAKPLEPARGGFVVAPVVYYTPETLFSWGIVGIHYFRFGRSVVPSRLSHYRFNLVRTQNRQTIAQVDYELYLAGGAILLDGQAKYWLYPDRFYGSGNRSLAQDREDFNARNWRLTANLQRRWGANLFTGMHLEMFSQAITETAGNGLLAAREIPGSRGARLTAIGLFGKWDSRDNTFSAGKGAYGALLLNFFPKVLGSDFAFSQLTLDARNYFPLGRGAVLAVQAIGKTTWGECPFQALPMFGGLNLLRGFYEGRYRDKSMLAIQAEYRLPLWRRFGLCAFAGLAQVQPRAGLLSLAEFHPAAGVGLRYKFNPRENLNVRLDVGFADSSPALYLTFAEAF